MSSRVKQARLGLAVYLAAGAVALAVVMPVAGQGPQGFVFDSPGEVKAGRALAEAQCSKCHGVDGKGGEDAPYLAGQRPIYLYEELKRYQSGKRKSEEMKEAVRFLSDQALRQAAAYYSSLEVPRIEVKGEAPELPDPVALGAAAAEENCDACHGEGGNSDTEGTPRLAGLHPQYLVSATRAYKDGGRDDETMAPMVEDLASRDIENIALYYGLQAPKRTSAEPSGSPGAGERLAASCSGCHGERGNSSKPDTPSLAGQDPEYLAKATADYRDGRRKVAAMESPVAALSDADIADLAAYYAVQTPKAPAVHRPLSIAEWAERCDRCHGLDGNSTDPAMPAIAGLDARYLARVMREYQDGERQHKLMNAMLATLSQAAIDGLAGYYARKQPKSVVFVRIPGK